MKIKRPMSRFSYDVEDFFTDVELRQNKTKSQLKKLLSVKFKILYEEVLMLRKEGYLP